MRKAFLTALLAAAAIAAGPAASLDAQQAPARPESTSPPGWVFIPAISVAETFDDNVLLATEDSGVAGDFLTAVSPRAALGYRGRQTTFRADYLGSYQLYQDVSELNAFEQRAGVDFRHRLSPYVTLFARNGLTQTPTTDDIELPGIQFRRQGVLMEDLRSGVDARFGPRTSLIAAYTFQWLDFEDDPLLADEFQQGGHSHGASAALQHVVSKPLSIGAEYDMRHATQGTRDAGAVDGAQQFDVQNALGTIELRLNERYELSGGAGLSWLSISDTGDRRTAPALRISLSRSGSRVAWVVGYRQSFLPSFGFGGTTQNQEFTANILAPLTRRIDVSSGIAVRQNEPLTGDLPSLKSIWARSSVSYLATRWMRVEAFYAQSFQDSQLPGGRVDRMRVGVQVVTSTRMRIR
jgi:hypothetical protein